MRYQAMDRFCAKCDFITHPLLRVHVFSYAGTDFIIGNLPIIQCRTCSNYTFSLLDGVKVSKYIKIHSDLNKSIDTFIDYFVVKNYFGEKPIDEILKI
jgi:hypothetical protein